MKMISVSGDKVAILRSGADTAGAYTVMELTIAPGNGTPPHVHHREDETFLIMDGEMTFWVEGQAMVRRKGEFLSAPKDVPHHYANTGATPARIVCTAAPAGIEEFFEKVGTILHLPSDEAIPLTPEAIALMIETAPKYGIDILVPAEA